MHSGSRVVDNNTIVFLVTFINLNTEVQTNHGLHRFHRYNSLGGKRTQHAPFLGFPR